MKPVEKDVVKSGQALSCLRCGFTWLQMPARHFGHGGYLIGWEIAAACPKCEHDYCRPLPDEAARLIPLPTYAKEKIESAGGA